MSRPPRQPTKTHCLRGHDLTLEGATQPHGGCRICAKERHRRAHLGLPPLPKLRRTTCQRGHDLSLPDARRDDGRCIACYQVYLAKDRERQRIAKANAQPRVIVSAADEFRRTLASLEWDRKIEMETRPWLRAELIAQRNQDMAHRGVRT